ncbi:hypothetical protein ACHAWF_000333 [Thalassiosira exigua]
MLVNRGGGGGVYSPEDIDRKPKTKRVIDVLHEKHPELMIPDLESEGWKLFEEYGECPSSVPLDCTEETVQLVAGKIGGGAEGGAGGLGGVAGQHDAVVGGVSCFDGVPDERPGQAARHASARHRGDLCVLVVCGEDAKAACRSTQLCVGLEAGIEGAIHSVLETAAGDDCLEFGEWELDNDIWEKEAEEGEVYLFWGEVVQ